MRRYSSVMSVLLTLALPVAATSAVPPTKHEKIDATLKEASAKVSEAAPKAADLKPEPATATKGSAATSNGSSATGGSDNPSGKVVETMNSGGYTYANLEKDGKKTWVAFPTLETRVGDTLSFTGCLQMPDFQSKTLNRKFDAIYFCGSPNVKSNTTPMAVKKSTGSSGTVAAPGANVKVEKATGANAYTVAEIFAKADKLNGKQVVVRGQVVKVSSGIMNRNWIHLQDGTGSKSQKTHDLVITTSESASEGDVVTASGTLARNKDFGSGYKYNVIVEKATLKK